MSALSLRQRVRRQFRTPVTWRHRVAMRPMLMWAIVALSFIALRLALLPQKPIPNPRIHDEYGYLLQADTFAHGHVTAPGPQHPVSFEAPHLLVTPFYVAKYPPGQAAVLAAGQVIFGHPWAGVVLSCAALVFLLGWAGQAWLPPQWALVTCCLGAIVLLTNHYWLESYWGGAVAACGGALVTGGLGYLLRGQPHRARYAMGPGAAILLITRPYEGGVLCLGGCALFLFRFVKHRLERPELLRIAAVSAVFVMAAAGGTMWYNFEVTGDAFLLPYKIHDQTYKMVPPLWVMAPDTSPRQYANFILENTYERAWDRYDALRSMGWPELLKEQLTLVLLSNQMSMFVTWSLSLIMLRKARLGNRKPWMVGLLALSVLTLFLEVAVFPHYLAPFVPIEAIAIVACLRTGWFRLGAAPQWRWTLVPAAVAIVLPSGVLMFAGLMPHYSGRATLLSQFYAKPGKHLVFIEYKKGWSTDDEWAFNGFDYANARVLFAHALTPQDDQAVIDAYPGRTVWHVTLGPDQNLAQITRVMPTEVTGFGTHP